MIMWFFDGGFVLGDKRQMAYYARDAARRGWLGVSVQYRTRPLDRSKVAADHLVEAACDAYEDALAAVDWLRGNGGRHRLDPELIVAAGYSAGAMTALHLVYGPGPGPGRATSPVAGGIAVSGDCLVPPTPGRPPVIMFHGRTDHLIPHHRAIRLCERARAIGNLNRLVTFETEGHAVGWRRAPAIRQIAAEFVIEHILKPRGYPTGPRAIEASTEEREGR